MVQSTGGTKASGLPLSQASRNAWSTRGGLDPRLDVSSQSVFVSSKQSVFNAQLLPSLTSRSPLKSTPVSYWHNTRNL